MISKAIPRRAVSTRKCFDRRVLNGIFWVPRSVAHWADLPGRYDPSKTCYNRFRRWTKAGIWDGIRDAITEA